MFGYIRPDDPYLYKKDDVLYKAMYCGLCKAIGGVCGQCARMGLTYDVAFLSVVLHNLSDTDVKIKKERCVTHWIRRQSVASTDEITEKLAAFNTIMCYYKSLDDFLDSGKKNAKTVFFKRGFKRASRRCPELAEMAKDCYTELGEHERNLVASEDIAADPFAKLACNLSKYVLMDKSDEHSEKVFYYLGKWIYLIDALDDYDKDVKSGNYNVFVCIYKASSGRELLEKHRESIFPVLNTVFWNLKESLSSVKFYFNKDLIENVLLRGIPKKTDEVVKKYTHKEQEKKCQ